MNEINLFRIQTGKSKGLLGKALHLATQETHAG